MGKAAIPAHGNTPCAGKVRAKKRPSIKLGHSPTGRYDGHAVAAFPSKEHLVAVPSLIKKNSQRNWHGRYAPRAWHQNKSLNPLFLNDFSVREDLLLNEVPEGGYPLRVAQLFGIGQKHWHFHRLNLG